jgi:hypothetical protein
MPPKPTVQAAIKTGHSRAECLARSNPPLETRVTRRSWGLDNRHTARRLPQRDQCVNAATVYRKERIGVAVSPK